MGRIWPDVLGPARHPSATRTADTIARYIDPLPIPSNLRPTGIHHGVAEYRIRLQEFQHTIHSQLPPLKAWGYGGMWPGPSIEASCNKRLVVHWENALPARHLFPIDPNIHGAMPPTPQVRAVTHLHGARVSPKFDGLPEKWYTHGQSWTTQYENRQRPTALWYHDHAVGITRLNVYAGLAGFYFLRDEQEKALNLPSGAYEVPLVLQDRCLASTGQLLYAPTHEDRTPLPPGVWGSEFFGDLPVVNGALYPYLAVEPRRYRLRVLNGANSRFFELFFNLAKTPGDIPKLVSFTQIGSDQGLLPRPAELQKILLAPAERADLIVDFSALAGQTVTLSNRAAAPYPLMEMLPTTPPLYELMQFKVSLPISEPDRTSAPSWSIPREPLDPKSAVRTRDLALYEYMENGHSLGAKIDAKGYDDPTSEIVKQNTVEIWRFINTTDDAHPMHLHLVRFQVVERQGFELQPFLRGEGLRFAGPRRSPSAGESGWKDTVVVNPSEVVTIIARFEGYTGKYVYHCHMLEHEDNDMMRPFEVIP
jgi:spore coat protein A